MLISSCGLGFRGGGGTDEEADCDKGSGKGMDDELFDSTMGEIKSSGVEFVFNCGTEGTEESPFKGDEDGV